MQVRVSDGTLEGEVLKDSYGKIFYSFKGIPYAEPPLGELRFQAPKPVQPWEGVRSAKKNGPCCIQANIDLQPETIGSEDCLYLNVFTPDLNPSYPLPVMVQIHGGGFCFLSGGDDWFDTDYLLRHGVILVTINYRLEVLGFLCLDTEDIPGNAGMKDQVAAMKWIKNNISSFGGDPNNITLFGISAGGASIAYHLVSPMSKGLFKRAIIQSGTNTCYWTQSIAPREKALALAKKLGCQSDNDKEISNVLKSVPAEYLINIHLPVTYLETFKDYWKIYFNVVPEKLFGDNERFFYGNINEVLRDNINNGVEVIVGCTKNEGILNLTIGLDKIVTQANKFTEYFVPTHIALNCPIEKQIEIGNRIKKRYFGNKIISIDDLDKILHYFALDTFVYSIIEWAKIYASSYENRIYVYIMSCETERNIMVDLLGLREQLKNFKGACHADDSFYTFSVKRLLPKVDEGSETFKVINQITTLWTNFAKYGNPTPDDSLRVKWKPFTLEHQDYLNIGNILVEEKGPYKVDIDFWEEIFEECFKGTVQTVI
ncbi:esterase FE4 isoform X1 [Amyelois transitella]|uniref:esterase FE4 isoform X1 n=1 Tax=Amyelois transitella TaxID=680683 RepID=UPI0029901201|nr:esterase FE4 isoform X1 [Amyelois transitella]